MSSEEISVLVEWFQETLKQNVQLVTSTLEAIGYQLILLTGIFLAVAFLIIYRFWRLLNAIHTRRNDISKEE